MGKATTTQILTTIKEWVLGKMSDIRALIPSQASAQNQLADKAFVNSSIATATANFRGTYNLVSDLSLTKSATQSQIASALASKMTALSITPDANDYAYVQVPAADDTPTVIARVDRYKYNGSAWAYEYSLNNSGFTAEQWAAINSGATLELIGKLSALPTNAQLTELLNGKVSLVDNGAYDVSANNGGITFASLSALLSSQDLSTLIPTAVRKGGMSIKYVSSVDNNNKYVQFRYMGTDVTGNPNPFLNTANWQGVDATPIKGSHNLIESGGVSDAVNNKTQNKYIPNAKDKAVNKLQELYLEGLDANEVYSIKDFSYSGGLYHLEIKNSSGNTVCFCDGISGRVNAMRASNNSGITGFSIAIISSSDTQTMSYNVAIENAIVSNIDESPSIKEYVYSKFENGFYRIIKQDAQFVTVSNIPVLGQSSTIKFQVRNNNSVAKTYYYGIFYTNGEFDRTSVTVGAKSTSDIITMDVKSYYTTSYIRLDVNNYSSSDDTTWLVGVGDGFDTGKYILQNIFDIKVLEGTRTVIINSLNVGNASSIINTAISLYKNIRIESDVDILLTSPIIMDSNTSIITSPNTVFKSNNTDVLLINRTAYNHQGISSYDNEDNIIIDGGIWDANNQADTLFNGVQASIVFLGVSNLQIRNITMKNCNRFGIQINTASNLRVNNILFENTMLSDSLHLGGDITDFSIKDIYGYSGDDMIALNAWDWTISTPHYGNITKGYISDIHCESCYHIIRMLGATDGENIYTVNNIDIDGVFGKANIGPLELGFQAQPNVQSDFVKTKISNISIRHLSAIKTTVESGNHINISGDVDLKLQDSFIDNKFPYFKTVSIKDGCVFNANIQNTQFDGGTANIFDVSADASVVINSIGNIYNQGAGNYVIKKSSGDGTARFVSLMDTNTGLTYAGSVTWVSK